MSISWPWVFECAEPHCQSLKARHLPDLRPLKFLSALRPEGLLPSHLEGGIRGRVDPVMQRDGSYEQHHPFLFYGLLEALVLLFVHCRVLVHWFQSTGLATRVPVWAQWCPPSWGRVSSFATCSGRDRHATILRARNLAILRPISLAAL